MINEKKRSGARQASGARWEDIVLGAMTKLGGEADLSALYRAIEGHPKTAKNPSWRATVRRTLQQSSAFENVASGRWRLKNRKRSG